MPTNLLKEQDLPTSLPMQRPRNLLEETQPINLLQSIKPRNLLKKEDPSSIVSGITRPFKAQAFGDIAVFSRGVAGFSERVDKIARFMEKETGLSRGGLFENAAKIWNERADVWGRRAEEVGVTVIDEIISEAVGGAIPGIAEFLLGVPFAAATGAAEAEERGVTPAQGAIIEGTKRAFLGKILKQVSVLKQPLRAGAMGTTFAAQAVGEGGDIKDITKSFVIGSLYSVGGKGQLGLREVTRNLKRKPNPSGAKAMELIKERSVNIDKATLDSEAFITKVETSLTSKEREAVPFIIQGIKDTKVLKAIGKEDLIPIIEKPSVKVLEQTEKVGKYYDEAHKFLRDNWGDVSFVENYVTQIWDIPKNRKVEIVNHFATINPFTKKRTIPTLEEGIKLGLEPKTTDIAELLRIYDQHKIKTVYNHKFAEELKSITDEVGNPLMMRADKAPDDWVILDHPALRRVMAVGKIKVKGVDVPILNKVPVKVHPEIAEELKIIFDNPFSHKAIIALQTVNAVAKKGMLSLSFFHHFALTESAFSSGIGREAIKLWNPYKIYDALKNKNYKIFQKQEMAKDSIEHGVSYGALSDVQTHVINKLLKDIEFKSRNIPILKQTTTKIRQANQLWDRALWDYYHNALKLEAYEKQVAREIKRQNPQSAEEINQIKDQIGRFVNDSFGGQNWQLSKVFGNPKVKQMAHWALLAPDWTVSTLKQAAAPFVGLIKGERATTVRGTLFWIRAALYYNIVAQSVNHYMTEKLEGEGRFTWDNPPGHKLNVFFGFNDDGSERYLRMGKQFREAYEWLAEPERKLGGKLSPVLREGIRQIAKSDPGSGYPTSFAEYKEFWSWKNFTARAASLAALPIPFSLRSHIQDTPHNFLLTLPASKGMTNFKTVELFKDAFREKDQKAVRDIFIHALRNNLDADALLRSAAAFIKSDITYESKDLANEIWKELRNLQDRGQPDLRKLNKPQEQLIDEYKRQRIFNIKVQQELGKIHKRQVKVGQLQKKHEVQGSQ